MQVRLDPNAGRELCPVKALDDRFLVSPPLEQLGPHQPAAKHIAVAPRNESCIGGSCDKAVTDRLGSDLRAEKAWVVAGENTQPLNRIVVCLGSLGR